MRRVMMKRRKKKQPAGIEYSGLSGVSASCGDAVMRLLQFGDRIERARILSCSNVHCLLLTVNSGDLIAVRSGFASGYGGEGPGTLSLVLRLMEAHGTEIEEYEVDQELIDRVDKASLTTEDLESLEGARPVRASRWCGYVSEEHWDNPGSLWKCFPPVVPYAVIDSRITDLAMKLTEQPDESLSTGYRRLEDLVRKRTGLNEHGVKLFSQAFQGDRAKLIWKDIDASESNGRASLFTAAYMAFRNPRAHREPSECAKDCVTEFLLLNHLYVLERQASTADQSTCE
jgi:hypothetical protein